jgi:hypothetical protein
MDIEVARGEFGPWRTVDPRVGPSCMFATEEVTA